MYVASSSAETWKEVLASRKGTGWVALPLAGRPGSARCGLVPAHVDPSSQAVNSPGALGAIGARFI
jgi:hypothetical protein